jgi:hypothetical protein
MESTHIDEAIELLEKANADLEPELLSRSAARRLLDAYARAQRLAAFGVAALARKVDDATELRPGDRDLGGKGQRHHRHRQGPG